MSLHKIKAAVDAAEGNARQMGEVVLMIAQENPHAAEVIATDLDNPEMSFSKCFSALYEYAKKHQKNYSWCCVCNRFAPENPVIQVVADFYKVPLDGVQPAAEPMETETQALTAEPEELDLMNLL